MTLQDVLMPTLTQDVETLVGLPANAVQVILISQQ